MSALECAILSCLYISIKVPYACSPKAETSATSALQTLNYGKDKGLKCTPIQSRRNFL